MILAWIGGIWLLCLQFCRREMKCLLLFGVFWGFVPEFGGKAEHPATGDNMELEWFIGTWYLSDVSSSHFLGEPAMPVGNEVFVVLGNKFQYSNG